MQWPAQRSVEAAAVARDKRSAQTSSDVSADRSYDNIEMETTLSATVRLVFEPKVSSIEISDHLS